MDFNPDGYQDDFIHISMIDKDVDLMIISIY
jgi:hypothetical protein